MKRNLLIRAASGAVLVAVIIAGVLWNDYSKYLVLSLIGLGGLWEFITLNSDNKVYIKRRYAIFSGILILLFNFFEMNLLFLLSGLFFLRCILELYRKEKRPLESISYEAMGVVYTILPIMLVYNYDNTIVLSIFALVWTNDVGAYLVGSTFGKHKLFEKVSPKKSWEGFFGGFVLTLIAAVLIDEFFIGESWLMWLGYGAAISIAAVYGDLFESMIKRSLKLKDSGSIIPGHGGFLDRFDAFYFAVPVFYITTVILNKINLLF